MSLRLRVNLLFAAVLAMVVGSLLWMHLIDTRRAVNEEITASNRIATQLLQTVVLATRMGNDRHGLAAFLRTLGRVRSTDIRLTAPDGALLYASPPSPYKAGRDAPAWYAHLVMPAPMHEHIRLPDSRLDIGADASRAVLDGWDDAIELLTFGTIAFVLGSVLLFWLLGRATAPLRQIVRGLERFERGDYDARLPVFAAAEAGGIARAFNRMGDAVQASLGARAEAIAASRDLQQSRELADIVQHRVEDERRQIARDLHDETSQMLTAIRSMSVALVQRADGPAAASAALIAETAARLHAAIHDLIPRLQAPGLDRMSLEDVLTEQVARWREQYPHTRFGLVLQSLPPALGESYALAAYRIVQESTTNALRHAQAQGIDIALRHADGALDITIDDDGRGLADDWRRPGHYGIRGMQERIRSLDGTFAIAPRDRGGVRVQVRLPLETPQ